MNSAPAQNEVTTWTRVLLFERLNLWPAAMHRSSNLPFLVLFLSGRRPHCWPSLLFASKDPMVPLPEADAIDLGDLTNERFGVA